MIRKPMVERKAHQSGWKALIACLFFTACSNLDLAKEAVSTIDMFGRQRSEQQSFLGLSTAIFYPTGVPDDVSKLPEIGEIQLKAIQDDLELQAKPLLDTLRARQSLLQTLMKRPISTLREQRFQIQSLNLSNAQVNENGIILIDAKVIQGVFRGIALKAMEAPTEFSSSFNQKQRIALYSLIQSRSIFLAANPSPTLGTVKDVINAVRPERSSSETALAAFEKRLELVGAMLMSEQASKSYDDTLAFIIAHEIGHRALSHYSRMRSGEVQKDLEEEADKFGALLVVLTRNRNVRPNDGFPVLIPGASMNRSFSGPWCFNDINHDPQGHQLFFEFGYSLAGFDSIGAVDPGTHPTQAARSAATAMFSKAAYRGIADAQSATGSCELGSTERQAVASNPGKYLSDLNEFRSKRLRLAEEGLAKDPKSEVDLTRQRILRPIVVGVDIHDAVYTDAVTRLR